VIRTESSQRGFTLLELLISTGLLCLITGALFTVVEPARELFVVQPEVQDVQQRLRFGVAAVQAALLNAGVGSTTGSVPAPLAQVVAPIRPYRIGDRSPDSAAGVLFRPDAVTVISIPADAIPARIRGLSVAAPIAMVDVAPNCATGSGVCGFSPGSRVAGIDMAGRVWFGTVRNIIGTQVEVEGTALEATLSSASTAMLTAVDQTTYSLVVDRASGTPRLMSYDGHLTDSPLVDHVVKLQFEYYGDADPPALIEPDVAGAPSLAVTYGPRPPGADVNDDGDSWPAGENCTFALVDGHHVSRLTTPGGAGRLTLIPPSLLVDGPWCPDDASPNRFDADLLRFRRVDVVLRVQASLSWLRGPVSLRFVNGGSGRRETRLVPDREIRFSVAPRNLRPVTPP